MFDELKNLVKQAPNGMNEEQRQAQLKKMEELKKAEEERQARQEQREVYKEGILKKLGEYLEEETKKDLLPDTKTEIVTLTTDGILFDNEGYKYTTIINPTGGTLELKIDTLGFLYSETLQHGFNKVNIANNSILKVNSNTSVILIRTNVKPV